MELMSIKEIFDEMNAIKCCRNDLKANIDEIYRYIKQYKYISSIPTIYKKDHATINKAMNCYNRFGLYIDVLMHLVDYKRGKQLEQVQIEEIISVLETKEAYDELLLNTILSLQEIIVKSNIKDFINNVKQKKHIIN